MDDLYLSFVPALIAAALLGAIFAMMPALALPAVVVICAAAWSRKRDNDESRNHP
jgi:hypothetical protein